MIDLYPLIRPILQRIDPEEAHRWSIRALRAGLVPRVAMPDDQVLRITLWGRDFPNPIGLAPGYDKHAEVADRLFDLGFGFVELGGVTPQPQPGNPKPRMFRLTEDEAVINRLGFNSHGLAAVCERLALRRGQGIPKGITGINLGKNKEQTDPVADYVTGAAALAPLVDFLVVNVSSPNTPGLRALQGKDPLKAILDAVQAVLRRQPKAPPLLLKVAPDITDEDKRDIAEVALAANIAGLIVGNTTITRPPTLRSAHRNETGGLSGKPLFAISTPVLRDMYAATGGKIPLIGCGGIGSGADAYAKIRAGASLVQLYSALVFQGPALVGRIARDLAALLRRDGFTSVAQAVGADHR